MRCPSVRNSEIEKALASLDFRMNPGSREFEHPESEYILEFRQALDQAAMVARRQSIDWELLYDWAEREAIARDTIDRLRRQSE